MSISQLNRSTSGLASERARNSRRQTDLTTFGQLSCPLPLMGWHTADSLQPPHTSTSTEHLIAYVTGQNQMSVFGTPCWLLCRTVTPASCINTILTMYMGCGIPGQSSLRPEKKVAGKWPRVLAWHVLLHSRCRTLCWPMVLHCNPNKRGQETTWAG